MFTKSILCRYLSLCIAMVLVLFTLAACGSTANTSGASNDTPGTSTPEAGSASTAEPSDNYPNRPITIIVPGGPGGASDIMSRTLAPFLAEELGTSVVVENFQGAGMQIGMMECLKRDDDGYAFVQVNQPHSTFTIEIQGAPYTLDDFALINAQHIDPINMIVLKDSKYKNLVDLIEDIKSNPGKVAIGAIQNSGPHALLLFLQNEMNLDFKIITGYAGAEGSAALLGGHIDVYVANVASTINVRDQTISLGVGDTKKSELWPEAETINDQLKQYGVTAPNLPSVRGFAFKSSFKEKYPQRWEKFVEAYNKAYHNPKHLEACEKTEQLPIMNFSTPEETQEMFYSLHEELLDFTDYFK